MDLKEIVGVLLTRRIIGLDEESVRKIVNTRIRLGFEFCIMIGLISILVLSGISAKIRLPWLIFSGSLLLLLFLLLIFNEFSRVREWNEIYQDRRSRQELLDFMRVVRSQRHDFNLHMQAISNMIQRGDYDNCRQYLDTFLRNVSRTNEAFLVHDPAVSALLSTYFELGQSRDIDMQFDICHNMEGAVMKEYQLNTILGNLLQNAIDEVETHKETDDRWILLCVMKRGRKLIFKVDNPYYGDIARLEHAFDLGYSTKEFHEGVGLANVKRILSLRNGSISMEYRNQVLSVIAQIPLNII